MRYRYCNTSVCRTLYSVPMSYGGSANRPLLSLQRCRQQTPCCPIKCLSLHRPRIPADLLVVAQTLTKQCSLVCHPNICQFVDAVSYHMRSFRKSVAKYDALLRILSIMMMLNYCSQIIIALQCLLRALQSCTPNCTCYRGNCSFYDCGGSILQHSPCIARIGHSTAPIMRNTLS